MNLLLTSLMAVALGSDFQIGDQAVKHTTLPNGLDMLWIDDGEPKIDVYVVYATGKYMDTQSSLAHMTEHAMFCTKNGAFDKILEPYVEATNAYTRNEHTTYYSTNLSLEALPTVLSREYERMDGIDADQECFEYELGRLLKEEKASKDLSIEWGDRRNGLLFGTGYAGLPGSESDLQLKDIQDFYDKWYQPKYASMVVVGAVGEANWKELQWIFSNLKNRDDQPIKPRKAKPFKSNFDYPLSKERLDWVWRGPSIDSQEEWLYWTILAKAHLLERGNDGLELTVDAGMKASYIQVSATGEDGEKRLADFYKRLEKGDVGAQEFSDAKDQFSRQLSELPIRGRPYFSVAPYLGYWAAWNRLPQLLNMLDDVKQLSATPSDKALSFIQHTRRSDIRNPKSDVGAIPDDPKALSEAAELAQKSGDIPRAIACYEQLLKLNPSKINAVIYHYYLGHLYLESGNKGQAKQALLDGLAIVEYPALRVLLEEIDKDIPRERGEAAVEVNTDRLAFEGATPPWAGRAAEVMAKLEEWRGLKFKHKVTIRFQDAAGYGSAGWYDYDTKTLVVGKEGSDRFGEGVMLHELYHALQDQHFDLGKINRGLKNEDHTRAFQAVVEGEAMLAVTELMNYDFLAHVKYVEGMTEDTFKKNFNYGEGLKFVKAIRKQRGWDGVGQLYTDTPLSTAVVLTPERYLAGDNQLQAFPAEVKPMRTDGNVIDVESKGAYGWMLFLANHVPTAIGELVPLYRADQYTKIERDGQIYQRWMVEFVSVDAAKRVQESVPNAETMSTRDGKQIVWEWQ